MIGIDQLDNLSSNDMISIINGELKIMVRDPNKIQTSISNELKPQNIEEFAMDNNKVITLLKMELESRAGLQWLHDKIKEKS